MPHYLRGAMSLSKKGVVNISSHGLAEYLGMVPWQIRKDFSYFGDFGKPGVGYCLSTLEGHIRRILKLNRDHQVALVGVGNLGCALLAYPGFSKYGLKITAAFDIDQEKVDQTISGVKVRRFETIKQIEQEGLNLGIIAVPEGAAQEVADALVQCGIRGIMNFSSRQISVPRNVKVIAIDIAMDLARLPYYVPAG